MGEWKKTAEEIRQHNAITDKAAQGLLEGLSELADQMDRDLVSDCERSDLVQTVVLKICEDDGQKFVSAKNPRAYARKMISNAAIDVLRRQNSGAKAHRQYGKQLKSDQPAVSSPPALAIQAETASAVVEAIARLSESDRQIVNLFYIDDRSIAEVAHTLGITVSAAAQRLSRARRKLKEFLTE
jgi:RNA polymerase sigma factor (sigma-70 family)